MSVTIRKKTKIAIDKINKLIDEIIGYSGGFSDDELLEICVIRIEENFNIKEEKARAIFGKNGVHDPVERRNILPPPVRLATTLTPEDVSEMMENGDLDMDVLKDSLRTMIEDYILNKEGYNEHFFDNEHDVLCELMKDIKIVIEY